MTYHNPQPITVHADHDGLTVRGCTDGLDGQTPSDFSLVLFNHAEVVLLLAHLRTAQDDLQDADPIGSLLIDGRLVGQPLNRVRVHLRWTADKPASAYTAVTWVAEVPGDARFLGLTLDSAAVTRLCADLEAAVQQVPEESEFHVWEENPGRVFDPVGGRDWIFDRYFAELHATTNNSEPAPV